MQLLFKDYTDLIRKMYEEKQQANQLSQLLIHPTTANIKQECLNVYNERINKGKEEENTLRAFFGVPPNGRNFSYVIERCNPDKFRPLQSLIKGEIKNPAPVNVELLAWLINFVPRPLGHAQKVFATGGGNNISTKSNTNDDSGQNQIKSGLGYVEDNSLDSSIEKKTDLLENTKPMVSATGFSAGKMPNSKESKRKFKLIVLTILLVAILLGSMFSYQWYRGSGQMHFGNANAGCMFWAYDHYEEVPCNEDRKGRLFLPLEREKIKSFRMITRKDTITEWSIERIYYIKDDNKIKYFTEPGNFPEDIKRTLKKLSPYIFTKDSANRKKPD